MLEWKAYCDMVQAAMHSGDFWQIFFVIAVGAAYVILPWVLLFYCHRFNITSRLLRALPTSKVKGVFMGMVEVKGTAESALPLQSFLAERECVHYAYTIEEKWRRVTTANGKTRTTTGWTTVAQGGNSQDFYLRDDTGDLLIRPYGAAIEGEKVMETQCGESDPIYYGKGPHESISGSVHRRRFIEHAVQHHSPIYVAGHARERADMVAPAIAKDDQAPLYLISTRSEEQIIASRQWKAWVCAISGLVILAGIPFLLNSGMNNSRPFADAVLSGELPLWFSAALVYFAVWFISWVWNVYNSLVDIKNRVLQGESLIDVQLKRRNDLIPRLNKIVSTYCEHESVTQEQSAALRAHAALLSSRGITIQALSESYPDLKAVELFDELGKQLTDTENRIALAREYCNSIANNYNTRLQVFPDGVLAKVFGLHAIAPRVMD